MNTKANFQGASYWLESGKLLDKVIAEQVCLSAARNEQSLVKYLVDHNILDSIAIAASLASQFGLPLLDIDALDSLTMPLSLVNHSLIQKHRALPLYKRKSTLFMGISDPSNLHGLDEIQFHTGCKIEAVIVEENKLHSALQDCFDQSLKGFAKKEDTN